MSFAIARSPFRVSFFGGGTDYPTWYKEEGGAVLSTTIDKYCHISCRFLPPFFKQRHRVVWSIVENVDLFSEITHPAVREGLRYLNFDEQKGLEIHYWADLPARAGMGSSSAFSVSLLGALLKLQGKTIDTPDLAKMALDFEQNWLKEDVGSQDQIAAAYGGFNHVTFQQDETFQVTPVNCTEERIRELGEHMILVYTGLSRIAPVVARRIIENIPKRKTELRELSALVGEGLDIVEGHRDLNEFGKLLHHSWTLKQTMAADITNDYINTIYQKGLNAGAVGGKLLGAGAGGFILLFAPPDAHQSIKEALSDYLCVPFSFSQKGAYVTQMPIS